MQAELKQRSRPTKSLKTNNPIMVSVGWRRYQTTPIYAREDRHGMYRMLEHTPEDVPCLAVFWGPLAPPNTRVVAVQSLADHESAFRILATGVVLNNHAAKIVKKSKRIGTPCKIFNDFALTNDMFTSDDEIDQFKDAKIETESGIGGS
ncbi:ribosome biogenesis protein BMS1 homolog [Papaver somniferum]|uniref:ribosome biogenesis protein BMS1 homolog n=1 Tax=Papaver somniferum TaxID=3469 RepID=UPI000E6F4B98|nr:ribosome biogenesis protein BMS1 homolog [Papaver somniferum]